MLLETLTMVAGSAGIAVAYLKTLKYRAKKERRKQEQLDLIQYGVPVMGYIPQTEESCPVCGAAPHSNLKQTYFRIARSAYCKCEEIPFGHFHSECKNSNLALFGLKLPSGCGAKWITRAKNAEPS